MLYLFMDSFFFRYTTTASFVKTTLEKKLQSLAEMASANSNQRKAIRARKTHRTNTSLLICQLARRYGWGNLEGNSFSCQCGKGWKKIVKRDVNTQVSSLHFGILCVVVRQKLLSAQAERVLSITCQGVTANHSFQKLAAACFSIWTFLASMEEQTNGWMDEWRDGLMDGWMDDKNAFLWSSVDCFYFEMVIEW